MSICFFEGEWRPISECRLPVTDLVIQRGVGVFDSIRLYNRRAFALDEHMKRLHESAVKAGIKCDGIAENLKKGIKAGIKRDDCPNGGNGIAKAYITGGDVNDLGKFPNPRSFVIIEAANPVPEDKFEAGIALQPTTETRPNPTVKSINYLFGIMQNVGRSDVLECLYCPDGEITETLRSSFFIYRHGRLITAPVGRVLGGITRNVLIQLAAEKGYAIEERCPILDELPLADEAFITSSLHEVMPVVRVGDVTIGNGKRGPIAKKLRELFMSSMDRWLSE